MKPLLMLTLLLPMVTMCASPTVTAGTDSQTPTAGASVTTKNLTADLPIAAATNYNPHSILVARYTGPSVAVGAAKEYELLVDGVAEIENTTSTDQTVQIMVSNSSPLCGSPYGHGQFGPGRVLTVTVPAYYFVVVPVSVVDFISAGNTSSATLAYRHASGPGLVAKANSYLDVKAIPASGAGVTNTPNEGPPFQPADCPAE